jgi:hypothetical protein
MIRLRFISRLCVIRGCLVLACLLTITGIVEAQSPRSSIDRRLRPNGGFWQSNSSSRASSSSISSRSTWTSRPTQSAVATSGRYPSSSYAHHSMAPLPPGRYLIQGQWVVVHPVTTPKTTVVQPSTTPSQVNTALSNTQGQVVTRAQVVTQAQVVNRQEVAPGNASSTTSIDSKVQAKDQNAAAKAAVETSAPLQVPVD